MAVGGVRYYHSGDYGLVRRYPNDSQKPNHYQGKTGQWERMPPQSRSDDGKAATQNDSASRERGTILMSQ